jgi:asparagine N-glycosylation enzyme membrane subunit Stt3
MRQYQKIILICGDVVVIFLLTVIGFASHQELDTAGWRLLTTFLPLTAVWFISALSLGALDHREAESPRQLWRPVIAMLLAGPLAVLLRGLWLQRPIVPIFGVVLTGSAMLGMAFWRVLFLFLRRRIDSHG